MRRCLHVTRRLIDKTLEKLGEIPEKKNGIRCYIATTKNKFIKKSSNLSSILLWYHQMQILKNNTSSLIFLCLLPDGVRIAAMAKNCHNDYKMKFSLDDEYPDLSKHNNHMAKVQILL